MASARLQNRAPTFVKRTAKHQIRDNYNCNIISLVPIIMFTAYLRVTTYYLMLNKKIDEKILNSGTILAYFLNVKMQSQEEKENYRFPQELNQLILSWILYRHFFMIFVQDFSQKLTKHGSRKYSNYFSWISVKNFTVVNFLKINFKGLENEFFK